LEHFADLPASVQAPLASGGDRGARGRGLWKHAILPWRCIAATVRAPAQSVAGIFVADRKMCCY